MEPPVLLRLARHDAFGPQTGLDHLPREPRQAADYRRGKGRSIVRAQAQRQAVLAECGIEHRPDMLGVVAVENLATQEIPAVCVAQGQRLAMRAVAGQKPPLEVHAPDVVRPGARTERRARRRAAAAHLALDRQARAIEQRADRARRRQANARILPPERLSYLDRAPGRIRAADRKTAFRN